jgi:hypothetical protein
MPWFSLRVSVTSGGLLGAALVVRYLLDMLAPPTSHVTRATVLTYTILGAGLLAGFTAASRTRSVRTGILTSVSAATVGALVSIVGTVLMLAVGHDPATLVAWQNRGGLDEAFVDVPLKVSVLGMVAGVAGATLGKLVSGSLKTH